MPLILDVRNEQEVAALDRVEEVAPAAVALRWTGGVAEGQEQPAAIDVEPVERELHGLVADHKMQAPDRRHHHRLAGIHRYLLTRVLYIYIYSGFAAAGGMIGEVAQSVESAALLLVERRLGMLCKMLVTLLAKMLQHRRSILTTQ